MAITTSTNPDFTMSKKQRKKLRRQKSTLADPEAPPTQRQHETATTAESKKARKRRKRESREKREKDRKQELLQQQLDVGMGGIEEAEESELEVEGELLPGKGGIPKIRFVSPQAANASEEEEGSEPVVSSRKHVSFMDDSSMDDSALSVEEDVPVPPPMQLAKVTFALVSNEDSESSSSSEDEDTMGEKESVAVENHGSAQKDLKKQESVILAEATPDPDPTCSCNLEQEKDARPFVDIDGTPEADQPAPSSSAVPRSDIDDGANSSRATSPGTTHHSPLLVVLDLEGTLVHGTVSRISRVIRRPYLSSFLSYLASNDALGRQRFDIAIYTSLPRVTAIEVLSGIGLIAQDVDVEDDWEPKPSEPLTKLITREDSKLTKDLTLVWSGSDWTAQRTVIIDDSDGNNVVQFDNFLHVSTFAESAPYDNTMLLRLLYYLSILQNEHDVPSFLDAAEADENGMFDLEPDEKAKRGAAVVLEALGCPAAMEFDDKWFEKVPGWKGIEEVA